MSQSQGWLKAILRSDDALAVDETKDLRSDGALVVANGEQHYVAFPTTPSILQFRFVFTGGILV